MAASYTATYSQTATTSSPFAHLPKIDQFLTQGGYDLHIVTTLVSYRLECELNAIGIRANEFAVLNLVSNVTAIPVDLIHARLHTDPLPTIRAIRVLRQAGYLQIEQGHGGVASLTPKGQDLLCRAGVIAGRCNDLLLASLSSEERRIFQLALQQILRQELSQWLVSAAATAPAPMQVEEPETFGQLTPREIEVYRLLRTGKSNQQIADALGIQLSTTKTHVTRILEKLGAHSRAEAAAFPPLAFEYAGW
jgi:DNA-binding NarL/FixJ family response regulator